MLIIVIIARDERETKIVSRFHEKENIVNSGVILETNNGFYFVCPSPLSESLRPSQSLKG
jgi:hypothetical protein